MARACSSVIFSISFLWRFRIANRGVPARFVSVRYLPHPEALRAQYAGFSTAEKGIRPFLSASSCAGVLGRCRFGFLPNRNGWSGQSSQGQSFTSLLLPQQQSRHFARIAFIGVDIIVLSPFVSALWPPDNIIVHYLVYIFNCHVHQIVYQHFVINVH